MKHIHYIYAALVSVMAVFSVSSLGATDIESEQSYQGVHTFRTQGLVANVSITTSKDLETASIKFSEPDQDKLIARLKDFTFTNDNGTLTLSDTAGTPENTSSFTTPITGTLGGYSKSYSVNGVVQSSSSAPSQNFEFKQKWTTSTFTGLLPTITVELPSTVHLDLEAWNGKWSINQIESSLKATLHCDARIDVDSITGQANVTTHDQSIFSATSVNKDDLTTCATNQGIILVAGTKVAGAPSLADMLKNLRK